MFAYVDLVLPGTTIGDEMSFSMIERVSRQIDETDRSTSTGRIERIRLRIERARQFATYLQGLLATSSAVQKSGFLSQEVVALVSGLDTALASEGEAILRRARAILNVRGVT